MITNLLPLTKLFADINIASVLFTYYVEETNYTDTAFIKKNQ